LIDYLLFYVTLKNFSLIWRRNHYRRRAAKFRPMLGVQGLSLSCHTCCDTEPRFSRSQAKDLQSPFTTQKGMWRIYSNPDPHGSPFSRLLRHTRGCGGRILTRIITGLLVEKFYGIFTPLSVCSKRD
jgi:hypothetical protein